MAWELGAGLGHVGKLHLLASAFLARGWRVTLALSQLNKACYFEWPDEVQFWQAPFWHRGLGGAPREIEAPAGRVRSVNMSTVLLETNWKDGVALSGQGRAWRTLLGHLKPTLLLADYAPVAMWMARAMSVPVANVGISMSVPLLDDPMPPLAWWLGPRLNERRAHDQRLLEGVESAARVLGLPPWQRAAQAWQADLDVLCTLPVFDYGAMQARPRECWGLLEQPSAGEQPDWPRGDGPCVFAYLQPHATRFAMAMQALADCGARVLVVAPGATAADQARWGTPRLRLCTRPLDMSATLPAARLAVTHGNHGTTALALAHGVPVLALPEHLEHTCNARGLQQAGAGALVGKQSTLAEVADLLREGLEQPSWRAAALEVARHPLSRTPPSAVATRLLDACEAWRRA